MRTPTLISVLTLGSTIVVGILNITLNAWVKKAADVGGGFSGGISSITFGVAVVIGLASLISLLMVYSLKVELSRGIVLMGATSIIGGTLYGVIFKKNHLSLWEWLLLATIVLWYLSSWMRALTRVK